MATSEPQQQPGDAVHPHTNEFGPPSPARRAFLTKVTLGLSAVGAAIVGTPMATFLLGPLLRRAEVEWRPVGPVARFEVGRTVQVDVRDPSPLPWTGIASSTAAWLRRESETEFVAFSVNCTHLGCPVRWLATAELFMCPCHGGVFYANGAVAAGPPAEPLNRYPVRIENGVVQLQPRIFEAYGDDPGPIG